MTRPPLTAERLRELLDYDPETGAFWRKRRAGSRAAEGDIAGWNNGRGYLIITIDGAHYRAHRLAFLWMEGCWPAEAVDHMNGNSADNRWGNLRKASRGQNKANSARKIGGFKGVYLDRRSKRNGYRAQINFGKKYMHIGVFKTELRAHLAYCKVAKNLHGRFFNNGVHDHEIFDAI